MPASPAFDLGGRVALVTGSSRGIGRSLADGLAAAGATVVLNGLDKSRLDRTRAELAERHGSDRVHASPFDITDEDQVTAAVAGVEGDVGPIDVLVNNAGIQHRVPMLDLDVADWRRVVEHNLTSAFIVGRAVARRMVERRRARSSISVPSSPTWPARPSPPTPPPKAACATSRGPWRPSGAARTSRPTRSRRATSTPR